MQKNLQRMKEIVVNREVDAVKNMVVKTPSAVENPDGGLQRIILFFKIEKK